MYYVNYVIADGRPIGHGGQNGEYIHPTLELAEKRRKSFLRSPWKGNLTKDDVATTDYETWEAYKIQKNIELGKPKELLLL